MLYKEMYIEDVERGMFLFPQAEIHFNTTREQILEAIKKGTMKGKIERLLHNVYFVPDGYVMCGNIALKGKVFFLRDGRISQIILYHGKKNEEDEYEEIEKYELSVQFLHALFNAKEKIFFWGSMRTYISTDIKAGEIYITLNHRGIDPYSA